MLLALVEADALAAHQARFRIRRRASGAGGAVHAGGLYQPARCLGPEAATTDLRHWMLERFDRTGGGGGNAPGFYPGAPGRR